MTFKQALSDDLLSDDLLSDDLLSDDLLSDIHLISILKLQLKFERWLLLRKNPSEFLSCPPYFLIEAVIEATSLSNCVLSMFIDSGPPPPLCAFIYLNLLLNSLHPKCAEFDTYARTLKFLQVSIKILSKTILHV